MKNYPMQYADREISVEDALEVLDEGEFITVATVDDDGMPYCVPLSYVVERGWGSVEGAGEGEEPVCRIYIHTTKNDGHKMADWRRDARVWVQETARDWATATLACGAAWRVRSSRATKRRSLPRALRARWLRVAFVTSRARLRCARCS